MPRPPSRSRRRATRRGDRAGRPRPRPSAETERRRPSRPEPVTAEAERSRSSPRPSRSRRSPRPSRAEPVAEAERAVTAEADQPAEAETPTPVGRRHGSRGVQPADRDAVAGRPRATPGHRGARGRRRHRAGTTRPIEAVVGRRVGRRPGRRLGRARRRGSDERRPVPEARVVMPRRPARRIVAPLAERLVRPIRPGPVPPDRSGGRRGRPPSLYGSRVDTILALIPGYQEGPAHRGRRRGRAALTCRSSSSTTARPTTPPPRPRPPARPSSSRSRTRARARRSGPASGTRSSTAPRRSSPSTPTASTTPPRSRRSSPRSRPAGRSSIIGRRDFGSMPPVRRLSNTLGGWVFSAAVGRRVADNQSGYRLIGRRLMTALLDSDRVRLRVRGRDDRPLHRARPADDRGPDPDDLRRRAEPHPAVART